MATDLRTVLMKFWLTTMQTGEADYAERIKASELLAKYFLGGGGATPAAGGKLRRPPTSEILSAAAHMEGQSGGRNG